MQPGGRNGEAHLQHGVWCLNVCSVIVLATEVKLTLACSGTRSLRWAGSSTSVDSAALLRCAGAMGAFGGCQCLVDAVWKQQQ